MAVPFADVAAFASTIVANSFRISLALWLQPHPIIFAGLDTTQIHRIEAIVIFFGALLILFWLTEKEGSRLWVVFIIDYTVTILVSLANGSYKPGAKFIERILLVVVILWIIVLVVICFRKMHDWAAVHLQRKTEGKFFNSYFVSPQPYQKGSCAI